MDFLQEPGKVDNQIRGICNLLTLMRHCEISIQLFNLFVYRIVAKYLHRRFLYHKERREDEAIKLLPLLEGKTVKETAGIFYEILVCSVCIIESLLCPTC